MPRTENHWRKVNTTTLKKLLKENKLNGADNGAPLKTKLTEEEWNTFKKKNPSFANFPQHNLKRNYKTRVSEVVTELAKKGTRGKYFLLFYYVRVLIKVSNTFFIL